MAYAWITPNHINATTGSPTSLAVGSAWTPGAGNHLFAVLQVSAAATGVAISDGVNTYTLLGSPTGETGTYKYYIYEANAVAATSITPSGSVSTGLIRGIFVREDSGLASPAYLSGSLTSAGVAAPGASGTISTGNINVSSVPSGLFVFCIDETGSSHVMTAGSGYTSRGAFWGSGNYIALSEDQRITSAGNVAGTAVAASTGGSDNYFILGAVFIEPATSIPRDPFTLYGLQPYLAS